jgi:hypothetical protein
MACVSCGKPAAEINPLTNAPMCKRHADAVRLQVTRLAEDAESIVKTLAAGFLPEMRQHDLGMLRRIMEQEIDETERIDMRLYLTARKIAAHTALEESIAYVVA